MKAHVFAEPMHYPTCLSLACCLFVLGCRDSDRIPTYPTTGKIVYVDGTPLGGGAVIFYSVQHQLGARSPIGSDGTFALGTYAPGDGAVAGTHQVSLNAPRPAGFDPESGVNPPTLPGKYTRKETSGLEFEVTAEGANVIRIEVDALDR